MAGSSSTSALASRLANVLMPVEQPQPLVPPVISATRVVEKEEINANLQKILDRNIPQIRSSRFSETKKQRRLIANITDWADDRLGRLDGIELVELTDGEVITLGLNVISEIQTRMTSQTIGRIFTLAFNLKSEDGTNVFSGDRSPVEDPLKVDPVGQLSDHIINTDAAVPTVSASLPHEGEHNTESAFKVAQSICFILTSYLRLFTKSPENYMKIQEHLKKRFNNFYSFEIAISDFSPALAAVQRIHHQFSTSTIFKHTLYRLLYAGSNNTGGENLKEFLYGLHLEYTGLHAFTLFARCAEVLKTDNVELLNAMDSTGFAEQLDSIATIYNTLEGNDDEQHKIGMWRYARIFERNFMSALQTRHCVEFTATLAQILHEKAPGTHATVLQIAPIAALGKSRLSLARTKAIMTIRVIEKAQNDDSIYEGIDAYD